MKNLIRLLLLVMLIFLLWKVDSARRMEKESLQISWKIAQHAPFHLGVIPYSTREGIRSELGPLISYLGTHLEREVDLIVATDYEMLGRLLDYGKIHFAWFSAASYEALNRNNAWEVICRPVRNGEVWTRGAIISRWDSGIKTLEDLRGKRFAYVDRNSGTGYVYANHLFRDHGIDPLTFLGEIHFSGNHKYSIEGILNGTYDGAATYDIARGDIQKIADLASLTILAETELSLNDPIVVRKDLDPVLKEKLRNFFGKMADYPDGRPVLTHLNEARKWERFMPEEEVLKLQSQVASPSVPSR